jgi:hypothetical protein
VFCDYGCGVVLLSRTHFVFGVSVNITEWYQSCIFLSALFLQHTSSTFLTNNTSYGYLPIGRNSAFSLWLLVVGVLNYIIWVLVMCRLLYARTIGGMFYCHNGYGCVKEIVFFFFRFLILHKYIPFFLYIYDTENFVCFLSDLFSSLFSP